MSAQLPFDIHRQPNDTTCGPTCLHAVYRYFGDALPLEELRAEIPVLAEGGTLGILLANHALRRGYRTRLVTWNLQVFDPTWFAPGGPPLRERLLLQSEAKHDVKLRLATAAYVQFLDAGGQVRFEDLNPQLLRGFLKRGLPILTGLSATYLYRSAREKDDVEDDVRGGPVGHFVVLTGYESARREVLVSDPLYPNPLAETHTYRIPIDRLIGAIYLGVLTYDANLIILEPGTSARTEPARAHRSRRQSAE